MLRRSRVTRIRTSSRGPIRIVFRDSSYTDQTSVVWIKRTFHATLYSFWNGRNLLHHNADLLRKQSSALGSSVHDYRCRRYSSLQKTEGVGCLLPHGH